MTTLATALKDMLDAAKYLEEGGALDCLTHAPDEQDEVDDE